jgi:hypothetical protein
MFSVMKIGTCLRPSWTAMVRPIISGMIIEARDQVRITVLELLRLAAATFFISFGSTLGPFLIERDIRSYYLLCLLRAIMLSVLLLRRVTNPIAGLPQGVLGPGIPTGERPSPPPCGWSRGVMAEPRTEGRLPMCRGLPAFPDLTFL